MIEIRKDDATLVDAAVSSLTRTFVGYPMLRYFEPDPCKAVKISKAWSEYVLKQGLSFGQCFATSPACEGVSVWLPGDYGSSIRGHLWKQLSIDIAYILSLRPSTTLRSIYGDAFLHKWHQETIAGDHRVLYVIGVAPEFRKSGFAAALVRDFFKLTDHEGLPCYVDTLAVDNVAIYQHLGFTLRAERRLPRYLGNEGCGFWCFTRDVLH